MRADRARLTTEGGTRCPVCGAEAAPRIDLGTHRLFACPRCASWSSDADARGASASFDPSAYFANAALDAPRWRDLLERVGLVGDAAPRVLDVGCGSGAFLGFLAGALPRSQRCGIEPDPGRAARAAAADPAAQVAVGGVEAALAAFDGRFDLITLWDVFEHLVDPRAALAALAARLAPGGSLFVQTIHEQSAVPRLGRALHALSGGRLRAPARRTHEAHHLVFFSRAGLERLARDAGLGVRALWFDRLARARMDGPAWLTAPTAALLALENALGNGLFLNAILARAVDQSR